MGGLWREKSDGRRAPGYFLYLLVGGAAVGAIVFLHQRLSDPAPAPRRRAASGTAAEVGAITRPAALMAPVAPAPHRPGSGERSYRLPEAGRTAAAAASLQTPSGPDGFNAISAALARPGGGEGADFTGAPADAGARFELLPPSFPPDPARPGRGATAAAEPSAPPVKLLEYRDPQADAGPARAPPRPAERRGSSRVPRGTLIAVTLLTTVDTSNPSAVLQFGVADDLIWDHRCQIPFGTRLLGKLVGRPMRDRLNLAVDTVLYPDGLELPISATAVEADETGADIRPGLAGDYVPPPRWAQVAPYVSEAVTGFLGLLQSRAQSGFTASVGGVSVQSSAPEEIRGPAYQAAGQGLQDFTAARLKEVEERYASYFLIPAGTACWLQLETDLDLSAARPSRPAAVRRPLPLSGDPSWRATDSASLP
jgi:hypothetical protein